MLDIVCPLCDGPVEPLGKLGEREHYRCRNCGMDCSRIADGELMLMVPIEPKVESLADMPELTEKQLSGMLPGTVRELTRITATDILLEVEAHRGQFFQENDGGATMQYLQRKLTIYAQEVARHIRRRYEEMNNLCECGHPHSQHYWFNSEFVSCKGLGEDVLETTCKCERYREKQ